MIQYQYQQLAKTIYVEVAVEDPYYLFQEPQQIFEEEQYEQVQANFNLDSLIINPFVDFQETQQDAEVSSFDFTPEGFIYPMNAIWLDASGRAVWVNDRGDPIWSK